MEEAEAKRHSNTMRRLDSAETLSLLSSTSRDRLELDAETFSGVVVDEMCAACRKILIENDTDRYEDYERHPWHTSIEDLFLSAKRGCRLCQICWLSSQSKLSDTVWSNEECFFDTALSFETSRSRKSQRTIDISCFLDIGGSYNINDIMRTFAMGEVSNFQASQFDKYSSDEPIAIPSLAKPLQRDMIATSSKDALPLVR